MYDPALATNETLGWWKFTVVTLYLDLNGCGSNKLNFNSSI